MTTTIARPTKIALIKDHLRSGKTLTQLEALGLYGAYRLAARIHDLKAQGWNINTEIRRDRNGSEYAVYSLAHQDDHGLPERYVGASRRAA
jgi:hypothetical protein